MTNQLPNYINHPQNNSIKFQHTTHAINLNCTSLRQNSTFATLQFPRSTYPNEHSCPVRNETETIRGKTAPENIEAVVQPSATIRRGHVVPIKFYYDNRVRARGDGSRRWSGGRSAAKNAVFPLSSVNSINASNFENSSAVISFLCFNGETSPNKAVWNGGTRCRVRVAKRATLNGTIDSFNVCVHVYTGSVRNIAEVCHYRGWIMERVEERFEVDTISVVRGYCAWSLRSAGTIVLEALMAILMRDDGGGLREKWIGSAFVECCRISV